MMSDSSLYYHFVEAHKRTPNRTDDFTVFLEDFDSEYIQLITAFARIDFYFLNLSELRQTLKDAINSVFETEESGA